MIRPIDNERGIALVITLLVVALLTITVVEFTFSAHVDQRMGRNALHGLQASLLARSGIAEGEAVLLTDKDIQFDSYLEDWGRLDELDTQLIVPENMQLKVRVVDETGKLNINKTRPTRTECQPFLDQQPGSRPRMWLTALQQIDPEVGEAVAQYWTTQCEQVVQTQPQTGGPQPTRTPTARNAAPTPEGTPGPQDLNALLPEFPTLDDAAAGTGFSAAAVRRLRPYVTALPSNLAATVNANTAPARVLTAIIGDEGAARDLISRRHDAPLSPGDISQLRTNSTGNAGDVQTNPSTMLGVKSFYFLIRASAVVNANPNTGRGGVRRSASMLVLRRPGAPPPGRAQSAQQGNTVYWTLTQLDWQKEGGAALFSEKTDEESGEGDTPASEFSPTGG